MKTTILSLLIVFITGYAHGQHHGHTHQKDTAARTAPSTVQKAAPKADTAQHHHHGGHDHSMAGDTSKPKTGAAQPAGHDHSQHGTGMAAVTGGSHGQHADHGTHAMSHAFSRNLPMTRNGSGTAWQPDNTPMYGYMYHSKNWMYMLHGNTFIRYNKQDLFDRGSRGGAKVDAPNMWMLMGQRNVGSKGLFRFSTMVSLDPLTVGASGYPLLFQTGESYRGQPLIDRQHPHDFFSELSVGYSHAFSSKSDLFIYVGYPGEPALGPSAYVHRASGFMNPDAPLTHHWVDATHITFGVATLGYRYGNWKIEASSFTGREPDENRYNFDKPRFDSWSGRLSFNPTEKWAMQVSHGFLKEPEVFHPGENVARTTASVQYSLRGYGETFTNFTALWGINKKGEHHGEHAALLEGSHQTGRTAVYGRYEFVQKSGEELGLSAAEFGHHSLHPIHALTGGTSYDLFTLGQTKVALGGHLTFFNPNRRLTPLYGDNPIAGQVYLRIYPRAMGTRAGRLYLPY